MAGVAYQFGEIAPNTTIPLLGILPIAIFGQQLTIPISATVILNEQSPLGAVSGQTVNAVHVIGSGMIGIAHLLVDIIVGGPALDAAATTIQSAAQPFYEGRV